MNTEIAQDCTTALSKHTPAVAEALLLATPENVWAIIATLLHVPGESGAPQAAIQRISDDQDPDSEKHELADKEPLYKPCPAATLAFVHSEPWLQREAPIHNSADGDELARPIRNIGATQAQGIAEQIEGTAINVLARANHKLGLALATDKIAYLVDVYLNAQATDAGIACNLTDAELTMFVQSAAVKNVDRQDYTVKDGRILYPINSNDAELDVAACWPLYHTQDASCALRPTRAFRRTG
ncbi:hypothetical protein H4R23_001525 [Coemansia sp. Cherry 401B]|nr:hypothetical protein H4R23_001525 [Coemansia sp. Cherry 401B]